MGEGDALAEDVRIHVLSKLFAAHRYAASCQGNSARARAIRPNSLELCAQPCGRSTPSHTGGGKGQVAALPQVKSVQKSMKEALDKAEAAGDAEALEELAAAQAIFRGHGPGGDL